MLTEYIPCTHAYASKMNSLIIHLPMIMKALQVRQFISCLSKLQCFQFFFSCCTLFIIVPPGCPSICFETGGVSLEFGKQDGVWFDIHTSSHHDCCEYCKDQHHGSPQSDLVIPDLLQSIIRCIRTGIGCVNSSKVSVGFLPWVKAIGFLSCVCFWSPDHLANHFSRVFLVHCFQHLGHTGVCKGSCSLGFWGCLFIFPQHRLQRADCHNMQSRGRLCFIKIF
mmetsp:Transcript_33131/g.43631  ORF Transcript_33131/g.43631 Transcript_33131/m.43631 type:complete len:223 (-) Transcript_33131:872-1540(-)